MQNNSKIALLTETWLDDSHLDAEIQNHVTDFSVFRCDRSNRARGGVAALISNKIICETIHNYSNGFCDLLIPNLKSLKICINLVYRPPDQTMPNSSFTEICDMIKSKSSDLDPSYTHLIFGETNSLV